MRISVITAVKNGENFIRQTIESVLSQSGDFELEYIIRDGCSTDRTLDIIKEYGNKIVLASQKDGSPQEAINAGMNMATGDIGCWLNADDVFLPGAIQKVVNSFKANPKSSWFYGRCNVIDSQSKEIRKFITYYKNIVGFFYSKNILFCENFINQPATFWKMDLWRQVQPLSITYKAAWDYELWLKMSQHAKAFPIRSYLASFRRTEMTISETFFEEQFEEELKISRKYGNIVHYVIHKFTKWKIIFIYKKLKKDLMVKNFDVSDIHTFVIPAYGESSYLEECIKSLLNQKVKSKILITTSTPSKFISDTSDKYRIPLVINNEKKGICSDWNFALSVCETKYCTLAHQDDIYEPEYALMLLEAIKLHRDASIVFCNSNEINETGKHYWKLYLVVKRMLLFPFYFKNSYSACFIKKLVLSFGSPIPCPSVLYNLENLKGFKFDSRLSVNLDWETWLKLANLKWAFVYVRKAVFNHRMHAESATYKAILDSKRKKEDLEMFTKIWPVFFAKILLKIYSVSHKKKL